MCVSATNRNNMGRKYNDRVVAFCWQVHITWLTLNHKYIALYFYAKTKRQPEKKEKVHHEKDVMMAHSLLSIKKETIRQACLKTYQCKLVKIPIAFTHSFHNNPLWVCTPPQGAEVSTQLDRSQSLTFTLRQCEYWFWERLLWLWALDFNVFSFFFPIRFTTR